MKPKLIFKVSKLMLLLFITLSTAKEQCDRVEHKSNSSIIKRKLVHRVWWREWVTSYEFTTLYNYTICNNVTLEIGKQLTVNNGQMENIRYIIFQNSTVPTIPVGTFSSYNVATKLYLNNSGVETMHPGAFSGMVKLEELYLHDNKIEVLEKGTLNYLSNLKVLDISRNRLQLIEKNCFLGMLNLNQLFLRRNDLNQSAQFNSLVHLKILDLSNNNFEDLEPTAFLNLQYLQKLLLNSNKLKRLSFKMFANTTVLEVLEASGNAIEKIDFASIPKTHTLNFSHNKLTYMQNWSKLENVTQINLEKNQLSSLGLLGSSVKILRLSGNSLKRLNASSLENAKQLTELDLGHNLISKLDGRVFRNLGQLRILRLNHNQIGILSVGCFQNLKSLLSLHLSHNLLTNLEFGLFTGLEKLETLVIDHNKLNVIHENSFYVLRKLQSLFLHDNLITSLNVQILLEHLDALKLVTLNNNNWTCNTLFQTIKVLQEASIEIPHGSIQNASNVHGIFCKNKISTDINATDTIEDSNVNSTISDADFNILSFYKFFSSFQKSDVYNYFNEGFVKSDFFKYLNNTNFVKYLKNKETDANRNLKYAPTAYKNKHFDTLLNQNNDLIQYFKTFSNRIIIFLAIMATTLLALTLLFLLIFYKPRYTHNTIAKRYCDFTRNEFELR